MNTEDNEMIETPWGKKRWRTIREAFEQRDEMMAALEIIAQHYRLDGKPSSSAVVAQAALIKAEGRTAA